MQLVMEYVPLGSLRDYLPRHSVGLAQLLLFAQQICEVGPPAPVPRARPPLGLAGWPHTRWSPVPASGPARQPTQFPAAQSPPILAPLLPALLPPATLPAPAPAWSSRS